MTPRSHSLGALRMIHGILKFFLITAGVLCTGLWIASYGLWFGSCFYTGSLGDARWYRDRVFLTITPGEEETTVLLRNGIAQIAQTTELSPADSIGSRSFSWMNFGARRDVSIRGYTSWREESPEVFVPLITQKQFSIWYFRFPLWLPLPIFGAFVCRRGFLFVRRKRRRQRGLCVQCAYNLTGLTEPRCPECGSPFR